MYQETKHPTGQAGHSKVKNTKSNLSQPVDLVESKGILNVGWCLSSATKQISDAHDSQLAAEICMFHDFLRMHPDWKNRSIHRQMLERMASRLEVSL